MEVIFGKAELDRLEVEGTYSRLNQAVVKAYRSRINIIRQAIDERDIYAFKALRFEKLQGKRRGQHSIRLNDQFRLIVELVEANSKGKAIRIIEITDYH